jgi:hypothetical protein
MRVAERTLLYASFNRVAIKSWISNARRHTCTNSMFVRPTKWWCPMSAS